MNSIIYGDKDFDVNLMLADFIVKHHGYKIEPGQIHENNQTVIDWINNAKQRINENG